jgi:hypothetical protein
MYNRRSKALSRNGIRAFVVVSGEVQQRSTAVAHPSGARRR